MESGVGSMNRGAYDNLTKDKCAQKVSGNDIRYIYSHLINLILGIDSKYSHAMFKKSLTGSCSVGLGVSINR